MKLIYNCYPCILRQVLSTGKLIDLSESQLKTVIDKTMKILLATSEHDSPQHIIVQIFNYVNMMFFNESKIFDPYAKLKKDSNAAVLHYFDYLESYVHSASSPLERAIKKAAAGNIIDFGAKDHGNIDIDKEIHEIPLLKFSIYDFKPLKTRLEKAKMLLYIGDNAGEIVFDRILIRQIQRQYPGIRIVFATREKPIINDVTIKDPYEVGLNKEAEIISSGCIYPGLMLDMTHDNFKELYRKSDIIIAKGQGNYEGLSDEIDRRLFFILRIKCERIAKDIGADIGSLVLFQKMDTKK